MKEYIEELREFKTECPDEWSAFMAFLATKYSRRTCRAVELLVECRTQKEALTQLAAEGYGMARATATSRLLRAKSELRAFWYRHPSVVPARLEPSQIECLKHSVNAMLHPYGLELGEADFFDTVPVKRSNGKRFDERKLIDIGAMGTLDDCLGELAIGSNSSAE